MMSASPVIFLAIIQGLTEFLPISSSGHLVLLQKIFKLTEIPIFFDILVHFGTLIAILIFFHQNIIFLTRESFKALFQRQLKNFPSVVIFIIVGSIPAAVIGLYLNDLLSSIFSSLSLLTLSFLFTSLLLFSTLWLKSEDKNSTQLTWSKAFGIGLFQATALFPGISRSGATIVAGEWLGLPREKAFEFSFLLSIPATLGALFLQIPQISALTVEQFPPYLLGIIFSATIGWLSLKILKKIVLRNELHFFGFYTLALSVLTFILV